MLRRGAVTSPLAARETEREGGAESGVTRRGPMDLALKGHDSKRTRTATGTRTPWRSFTALFLNLHLCLINT